MIVIRNSTIINGIIFAGIAALCYHFWKKDEKRREEFKEYKKKKLKDFNADELIGDASICNNNIADPSDRAIAREIMEDKRTAINWAITKDSLDKAYADFMHTYDCFTTRTREENKADIEYYKKKENEKMIERERRHAEMLEREKVRRYTSTAVDIASMAFNKGGVTI